MSLSVLLLLLWWRLLIATSLRAAPPLAGGYFINCGASQEETIGSVQWIPDQGFTNVGNVSAIATPNLVPFLSTVRYFPDASARKYCFVIPVTKGAKYLIRSTYYYGGFDGGQKPPVFDQIIDGTKWCTVNTAANYDSGMSAYYEIVVAAQGRTVSFCLARNEQTTGSPFISALELVNLGDSMYNGTDFGKYALSTVARNRFGQDGDIISYPEDAYSRYWEAFTDSNPMVECHSNITSSEFWNHPPEAALQQALTTSRGKQLVVQWPSVALPAAVYYVALYFQDNRTPSPYSWRVFDVTLNGHDFFRSLNVSTDGVMVFGAQWSLSGKVEIVMSPSNDSPVGPVINAGEIFQVVPFGDRTLTREVIAMEELARSLKNPPPDWTGDPCLPREHSWTGVLCSQDSTNRVVALNLTNFGLSGTLPNSIDNLTALANIWLSGNKLYGPIPKLSSLKNLVSLHLQDNEFSGPIPSSLGELPSIKEIYLQNNQLTGPVPDDLKKKTGVDIKIQPGNQIQ
ncbi:probable LRR receptor-like serine/threonine-protein kinase At1g67720 [Zingiber officinale]|uniref:Malectin-like domain-containing protein n=1 Tax=Zingiber officinale TaxID=94328 RepID=A0A8J5GDL2_ZINOF|nr:probable LRR receptor-like serine/threonine-protein kinase At1g67720 [Zingiber officinale]KAG6503971.1 hypothetical protein ZIOFF_036295 [Zingiber officinale]